MGEIWRDIKGFEGIYQVSSNGRVRSLNRKVMFIDGRYATYKGKMMKPTNRRKGYLGIILTKNNKQSSFFVHRLVAEAFIPNPNNLPQINHKDENKKNNNVENLEWCDCKYNVNYGSCKKNMSKSKTNNSYNQKPVICIQTKKCYKNSMDAQRCTGINARNIRAACAGYYKTAGGYKWKWLDEQQSITESIREI